ncbi:MAG: Sec-independent protein translocase subunit TatA/TatB [Gemmatimonadaceae bacterium]
MPHFGFAELVIIMVVILLLFGAKRIPEIAGSMGKGIKEFKKNINEAEQSVTGANESYPPPRLTAEDLQRPSSTTTAPVEADRPEPRRLI